MFNKLAKAIRDILKTSGWLKVPRPLEWHQRVFNRLEGVGTQDQLFDAVLDLEGLISAYIADELSKYSPAVRIANQPNRSEPIWAHARTLFGVYRLLAPHARDMAAFGDANTRTVASKITLYLGEGEGKDIHAFLNEVANFALLSLLISARSEAGQRLVNGLAAGHDTIQVRIHYKSGPSSLLAFAASGNAFCAAQAAPTNPFALLQERTKPMTRGTGGGSALGVPVWFDGTTHDASNLQAKVFKHQSIDEALSKLLMGSISFAREATPFFTPVRIELVHELIHVLHNTRGANRERLSRLPPEEQIWTNAEEYWTIAGGNLCENVFNALIGLPDRHGHGGLSLLGLDPRSELAQSSFRECAGL